MLIKIDYREIKLIQFLTGLITDDMKIKMVSENLPLGDVIICDDLGQEKAIIERKSLADLAASIRDGRYKEQSFRLNQCSLHNHQIYYLIEGDLRYYKPFKGSPDKKALFSAMTSISFFKGFSLQRTMSLEETAEWLLYFTLKIEKEGARPFYSAPASHVPTTHVPTTHVPATHVPATHEPATHVPASHEPTTHESATAYAEVIGKRIKKDNITPENIGEIMLSQIPSVSPVAAAAIMQQFGTLAALLTAIQADATSLNAITTVNKNGQRKKLAKPCINAIFDFLVKRTIINVDI